MGNFSDEKRKKASVTKWTKKVLEEIDMINQKVGTVKGVGKEILIKVGK